MLEKYKQTLHKHGIGHEDSNGILLKPNTLGKRFVTSSNKKTTLTCYVSEGTAIYTMLSRTKPNPKGRKWKVRLRINILNVLHDYRMSIKQKWIFLMNHVLGIVTHVPASQTFQNSWNCINPLTRLFFWSTELGSYILLCLVQSIDPKLRSSKLYFWKLPGHWSVNWLKFRTTESSISYWAGIYCDLSLSAFNLPLLRWSYSRRATSL